MARSKPIDIHRVSMGTMIVSSALAFSACFAEVYDEGSADVDVQGQELKGSDVDVLQRKGVVLLEVSGVGSCTGTIVGNGLIITAAHCFHNADGVPATSNGGVADVRIYYKRNTGDPWLCIGSNPNTAGGCTPGRHRLYWDDHYDATKDVDAFSDAGVIVSGLTQCRGRSSTGRCWHDVTTAEFARIHDDSLSANQHMYIYGYGAVGNSAGPDGQLRRGFANVDHWGTNWIEDESGAVRTCRGDSGGPWMIEPYGPTGRGFVAGSHATSPKHGDNLCTYNDAPMTATRWNAKVWVIENAIGSSCGEGWGAAGHYRQCW